MAVAVLYAIDACAIINLFNAGYLEFACRISRCEILVTPIVLGECGPSCAAEVMRLQALGLIAFVDDDIIPLERFLELVAVHDIGDGEVEAIATCERNALYFCSDDGKARVLAGKLLGEDKVIGSLRLLKWIVEDGDKPCGEAFTAYQTMLTEGGFLPRVAGDFFCAERDC